MDDGSVPETSVKHPPNRIRLIGCRVVSIIGLVLGLLFVAAAILLPVFRGDVRGAVRQTHCKNNLKQIGLALYNYESKYNAFPPACTTDANGVPLHSWRTLLLPFYENAELDDLYRKIDLSIPWNHPANARLTQEAPAVYRCPAAGLSENLTTYLGLVSPGSVFRRTEPCPLSAVTDPFGQTLLVIEVAPEHAVHWMSPTDAGEAILHSVSKRTQLTHKYGRNALMADGTIRFLGADLPADTLRALATASGKYSPGEF